MKLDRFWHKLCEAYSVLSMQTYQILVPFVTTYLCELNTWNKLRAEHDRSVALSKMLPKPEILATSKQQQG
jgi:hypothetical protein